MSNYYTDSIDAARKAAQDSARAAIINKPYVDSLRTAALEAQNAAQLAADQADTAAVNAASSADAAAAAATSAAAARAAAETAAGGVTGAILLDTDGTPYFI